MRHSISPRETLRALHAHLLCLPLSIATPWENAQTATDCLLLLGKGNHVLEEVQPEDD